MQIKHHARPTYAGWNIQFIKATFHSVGCAVKNVECLFWNAGSENLNVGAIFLVGGCAFLKLPIRFIPKIDLSAMQSYPTPSNLKFFPKLALVHGFPNARGLVPVPPNRVALPKPVRVAKAPYFQLPEGQFPYL